jgi:hypothetical protein
LLLDGHLGRIDTVLIADETDAESPGMRLADTLNVDRAPFFVIKDGVATSVYTVYFKFVNEVLRAPVGASAEAAEILQDNPDLDYV